MTRRTRLAGAVLLPLVLSVPVARAADWYAATNGSGGPGTNWVTAFTSVQDALNAAASNDTVYLASHTFRCPSQVNWTSSFVTVLGGYAGNGAPGDLTNTATVLTRTGGLMRVMGISGVTNGSMARVTVSGGLSSGSGGGLFITNSAGLTLASCTFSGNRSYVNGGGLWIGGSTNVTLASCSLTANTQQDSGSDWVYRYGGGLYALNSYGSITNCTAQGNTAQSSGHNSMYGGAFSLVGGVWTVADSVLAYNVVAYSASDADSSAPPQGGAMHVNGGTHVVRNALLYGNDTRTVRTTAYGDAISLENGNLRLLNSTLYGNVGEAVRRQAGALAITNCIFWRNLSADIAGSAVLAFTDTERGVSNGVNGCIAADPRFELGFYLATNSPCVDAGGTNSADLGLASYTTRADGTPDADRVDMGYHYANGLSGLVSDLYVAPGGTNTNDGLSWATPFRTITKALSMATAGTRIHVASGSYTNGLETFPLGMTNYGMQLLGTNSATTIISAAGSSQRVLTMSGVMHGGRVEGLTLTGGNTTGQGGGINVSFASDLTIASCVISNNLSRSDAAGIYVQYSPNVTVSGCALRNNDLNCNGDWVTVYGGGLYAYNSTGMIANCAVAGNQTRLNLAGYHSQTRGGGMALAGGSWAVANCVVASNRTGSYTSSDAGVKDARGAGLYVNGSACVAQSCLLHSNDCFAGYSGTLGDAVAADAGSVVLLNCTLADNAGEGIRRSGGTVAATNSILWANGDDVVGTVTLAYSDIEDGDSVGVTGCISNNPAFSNGYRLSLGSPCINTGTNQPWMSGAVDLDGNARINNLLVDMGAYEALIPLTVTNRPATGVSGGFATLNGSVLSTGLAPARVWVFWGTTDAGAETNGWANTNSFGEQGVVELSTNVALTPPSGTYYYRFYATNAEGVAWASPSVSFVAGQEVWVTASDASADELGPDTGAFQFSRTASATGSPLQVFFTLAGAAVEGADYQSVGGSVTIPAGASNATVTITPLPDRVREPGGETVALALAGGPYAIGAPSNAVVTIADWTPPTYSYVSAGGSATYGTNWATAYTNLQQALDMAVSNDTLYVAAQTFALSTQVLLTASHVALRGGYAGDGDPGNPAGTPTVLRRAGGADTRVLLIAGATNVSLSGVTITGGNITQRGGGLCISNSLGVTLDSCTVSNNAARLNGGGIYIVGSTNVTFASCLIAGNTQQDSGSDWVYRYGGGVYAENSFGVFSNTTVRNNMAAPVGNNYMSGGGLSLVNGGWSLTDCVLAFNRVVAGTIAQGGALHINGGTHRVRNSLVIGNEGASGDGVFLESGNLAVLNATFYGNVGEGARRAAGTLSVSNAIFWRNMSADVVGGAGLGFCDTESGLSNGVNGCISADPLFEKGFYLAAGSPCTDAGSTNASDLGLSGYTTRADGATDADRVDLGHHHAAGITVLPDLYVAVTGADSNDGLSWATAFRSITKALTAATVGTRIHVGAGTYANGFETFPLNMTKHGLQLLGTNSATTIISAAGSGQRALNVSEVMVGGRVQGITLAGGNSAGSGGGASISMASDLSVESCVIAGNRSDVGGGGIYVQDSPKVAFVGCTLTGNVMAVAADWGVGYGGGLYAYNSKGAVSNCVFRNNHTYNAGGHGVTRGGGFAVAGGAWLVAECAFVSNRTATTTSSDNGGNSARGAGAYVGSGTHTFRNTLIARNDCYAGYAGTFGDGAHVDGGSMALQSCTLADNSGEGMRSLGGSAAATNSILWGNGDDVAGTVTLGYCDVEDGDSSDVNGCIAADPLFLSAAAGDYRPKPVSPCINAGTNETWMLGAFDLDGSPRIKGGRVDIGAYESQGAAGTAFVLR